MTSRTTQSNPPAQSILSEQSVSPAQSTPPTQSATSDQSTPFTQSTPSTQSTSPAQSIPFTQSTDTTLPAGELFDRVVADYGKTNSVRRTAENCHTSMVTAQRILITAGLWSSRSTMQVQELLEQGKAAEQIAEELHLTKDAVYACMPYSRGMYKMEQTEDAQYSRDYRNRMETAEEGMRRNREVVSEPKSCCMIQLELSEEAADSSAAYKFTSDITDLSMPDSVLANLAALRFDPETTKELADRAEERGERMDTLSNFESVYALHLSLVDDFCSGAEEDLGLNPKQKEELLHRAKAKEAISRDIFVPGGMNLHALHYAIQRLFGWQNSHLHNFSLPQEEFDRFTAGCFGGYTDLCGTLFRFPDDDLCDVYWDDDYKKGVSVKTWMKKKYTGPYMQLSVGDTYLGNQWEMEEFRKRFPDITDETMLKDIQAKVYVEQDFNYLIERLTVGELFALRASADEEQDAGSNLPDSRNRRDERTSVQKTEDTRAWKGDVVGDLELLKEDLQEEEVQESMEEMKHAAVQLRGWRQSLDQIDQMSWMYAETYKQQIEQSYGKPLNEILALHREQIDLWTWECMEILELYNINLTPHFDTLYYLYDYGDGWCVKITVEEIYHRTGKGNYADSKGHTVSEELEGTILGVDIQEKPVCVAADGLNLVDDCGGIYGYLEMLRTIGGKDKEEAAEMKEWARGLGWTGRKSRVENML